MARIRSIKPELPQSESMGNVSREARLCFILLFTVSDDHGKLRGNSRMLASLLCPYDDDAPKLIDKWLDQLEREKCIFRYDAEGASYIRILKWEEHQKVDRPSTSKIPDPPEGSCRPREASRALAVGSEDQGRDQGEERRPAPRAKRIDVEVLPDDWKQFCKTERPDLDPEFTFAMFRDHFKAKSGPDGTKLDWLATWKNWVRRENKRLGVSGTKFAAPSAAFEPRSEPTPEQRAEALRFKKRMGQWISEEDELFLRSQADIVIATS